MTEEAEITVRSSARRTNRATSQGGESGQDAKTPCPSQSPVRRGYDYSYSSMLTRGADGAMRSRVRRSYADHEGRRKVLDDRRLRGAGPGAQVVARRILRDGGKQTTTLRGVEGADEFEQIW